MKEKIHEVTFHTRFKRWTGVATILGTLFSSACFLSFGLSGVSTGPTMFSLTISAFIINLIILIPVILHSTRNFRSYIGYTLGIIPTLTSAAISLAAVVRVYVEFEEFPSDIFGISRSDMLVLCLVSWTSSMVFQAVFYTFILTSAYWINHAQARDIEPGIFSRGFEPKSFHTLSSNSPISSPKSPVGPGQRFAIPPRSCFPSTPRQPSKSTLAIDDSPGMIQASRWGSVSSVDMSDSISMRLSKQRDSAPLPEHYLNVVHIPAYSGEEQFRDTCSNTFIQPHSSTSTTPNGSVADDALSVHNRSTFYPTPRQCVMQPTTRLSMLYRKVRQEAIDGYNLHHLESFIGPETPNVHPALRNHPQWNQFKTIEEVYAAGINLNMDSSTKYRKAAFSQSPTESPAEGSTPRQERPMPSPETPEPSKQLLPGPVNPVGRRPRPKRAVEPVAKDVDYIIKPNFKFGGKLAEDKAKGKERAM